MRTLLYRYRSRNLYSPSTDCRPHWRTIMERPLPARRCAIFFTPRSGSSYLTDLITGTGVMGDAAEVFNPAMVRSIARAMGATSFDEYIAKVLRARNTHDMFSAELTWPHLLSTFHTEDRFLSILKPESYLWLTRDDIVAQAVSNMAMIQTGVGHTKHASPEEISAARSKAHYDARSLKSIIRRLVWSEQRVEDFFARHAFTPLRLRYEDIVAQPKAQLLNTIAGHIGVTLEGDAAPATGHAKLSGAKNTEFADRFRAEEARFVARMEGKRPATRTP